MARLFYVYGIVPAGSSAGVASVGIDDSSVTVVEDGSLAALVSELTGDEYHPEHIAAASGNMDWMGSRARSHDGVLTACSDRGPVIPFAMFTAMFTSLDGVRAMLKQRATELKPVMDRVARGREYILRVYRVDGELKAALPSLNAEIARLKEQASAASPGQRYLLERKLDERSKDALRTTGLTVAAEIRDALAPLAVESTTSPIPKVSTDAPGVMVLNAAFLIGTPQLRAFQERLTAIVNDRQPHGFRFDFTGPWPPYHFAGAA
jgi:hypothetical protein